MERAHAGKDLYEFTQAIEGLGIPELLHLHFARCEDRKKHTEGTTEYVSLTQEIAAINREIVDAKHRGDGLFIESADHSDTGY